MKLSKIENRNFRYAKEASISDNYVILYTGQRALILNKSLEVITEIEKLYYVYRGCLSPDETKLLLVSNGNIFYITSMSDKKTTKYSIKPPYEANLEGQGCWSFDGDAVYIPVQNSRSHLSTLRKYDVNNNKFIDLIPNRFFISRIFKIDNLKKFLLLALDRETDLWNIVWYDDIHNVFAKFPIENFHDAILNAVVDENNKTISLFGMETNVRCDYSGRTPGNIEINLSVENFSFFDTFKNMNISADQKQYINELIVSFKLNNLRKRERINTAITSSDAEYLYIGTTNRFIVMDINKGSVAVEQNIEYGVQSINELSPGTVLLSTWSSMRAYKLVN